MQNIVLHVNAEQKREREKLLKSIVVKKESQKLRLIIPAGCPAKDVWTSLEKAEKSWTAAYYLVKEMLHVKLIIPLIILCKIQTIT